MSTAFGQCLANSLMRLLPPQEGESIELKAAVGALGDALAKGELGLNLEAEAPDGLDGTRWPGPLVKALKDCGWLVTAAEQALHPEAPIIQDGRWLRWRRWYQLLSEALDQLITLGSSPVATLPSKQQRSAARQRAEVAGLDHQQCNAVLALLERRLVVLMGGPGTGKTSTVVQMLAAALDQNPNLRIGLAAPTGKAAARLQQAVASGSHTLKPATSESLRSLTSSTLHRLLESQGESRFRRNRALPLELDLLVVDEVSMVDLPLMTALLDALPDPAQLLLVGDPHQLPPVGPGAVLQELTHPERLQQLGEAAVELRTTYRNNGAIAALASHLRQTDAALEAAQLSRLQDDDNVVWLKAQRHRPPTQLLERLRAHQQQLRTLAEGLRWQDEQPNPDDADALLHQLEAWIALSPVRQGPWGVETLNRVLLGDLGNRSVQHWPEGTPVLNRLNRPDQGLSNGDIGVVIRRHRQPWVLLPGPRLLHPAQLSGAEPAFALTVHKSQGSQYTEVALLLPPLRHQEPRLVYTGLTRARSKVLLFTPSEP